MTYFMVSLPDYSYYSRFASASGGVVFTLLECAY
jgi:hypothetical protein